jgi:hypothetical protein
LGQIHSSIWINIGISGQYIPLIIVVVVVIIDLDQYWDIGANTLIDMDQYWDIGSICRRHRFGSILGYRGSVEMAGRQECKKNLSGQFILYVL